MTRTIDPGLMPRYYKIMNGRLDTEELYSAHDAELLLKTVKPGETMDFVDAFEISEALAEMQEDEDLKETA